MDDVTDAIEIMYNSPFVEAKWAIKYMYMTPTRRITQTEREMP